MKTYKSNGQTLFSLFLNQDTIKNMKKNTRLASIKILEWGKVFQRETQLDDLEKLVIFFRELNCSWNIFQKAAKMFIAKKMLLTYEEFFLKT